MKSDLRLSRLSVERGCLFEVSTLESPAVGCELCWPTRQAHYRIIWITHGSGVCRIDLEQYPIADNSIFIIPPGRVQEFHPEGELSGYLLSFNSDFLNLAWDSPDRPILKEVIADLKQATLLSLPADCSSFQHILQDMTKECVGEQLLRLEILSCLFQVFLIYLKRLARPVAIEFTCSPKMQLFNTFHARVDKQFKTMKQVADYASELAVSPRYLTTVVKKVSGFSASYHIQQRTLQEAKRLAMYSHSNMKVVAYSLGFDDLSHFSKFFKNGAGISFSEFKKSAFVTHVS